MEKEEQNCFMLSGRTKAKRLIFMHETFFIQNEQIKILMELER